MKRLSIVFNPFNSLFGRIFVWFWLAIIMMVTLSFFVARLIAPNIEISAVNGKELAVAKRKAQQIEDFFERDLGVDRALRRVGMRGQWLLIIKDTQSGRVWSNVPLPMQKRADFLDEIEGIEGAVSIRFRNMLFTGPIKFGNTISEIQTYQLFVGRLLPHSQRPAFVIGSSFFIFLLVGTLCCFGIALTITKPIKKLQTLSQDYASGKQPPEYQDLKVRKDEIGILYSDMLSMTQKLNSSLSQQQSLMANISHELRTPLTRLQLAMSMLSDLSNNEENKQRVDKYITRMEKDIQLMDRLIGQALLIARHKLFINEPKEQTLDATTAKSKILNFDRQSLIPLLSSLMLDLEFEAKAHRKKMIYNAQVTDDCELEIHTESFISVIENVCRNAIKYSKETVRIKLQKHSLNEKHGVSFIVEDDGNGVNEDEIGLIFEPFYRAQKENVEQGTGLGLTIVKTGVELHKGSVMASRSDLGGLKVTLFFPDFHVKVDRKKA